MPTVYDIYRLLFRHWRRRRHEKFLELIHPAPSERLLDVGGYPDTWVNHPQPTERIDILNVHEIQWDGSEYPDHRFDLVVGDGCSLTYETGSYDIVYSNSVIEHLGSWERQEAFASELRRVGGSLWIQTPAFECPVEPHYLAPVVHWLPEKVRGFVARWLTPWGWLQRPGREQVQEMVAELRLLSRKEMERLFPDCMLITERLLWVIPKSYIAVRVADRPLH